MHGIDDDARQARGVEHAFLEIEIPGAVLLRHEAALQAVGEARHHALQAGQLLVEIVAQPRQFLGVAEVLGGDLFVELVGEDLVEVFIGQRREGQLRAPGLFALGLFLALLVVGLLVDVHLLGVHLGGLGLALGVLQLLHRLLLAFLVLAFGRFLALAGIGLGLVLVVVLVRLVGVVAQFIGHLEGGDDVARHARQRRLVVNVVGRDGPSCAAAFSSIQGRQRSTIGMAASGGGCAGQASRAP